MHKNFDPSSTVSILKHAKLLKNKTLRQVCDVIIENHSYKGKGNFGQLVEKFHFGYNPNSNAEADFGEVGMELKCSPLKTLKKGQIRSKERLVLNIINYMEVVDEIFENSSFWKKNEHLLLVFYLYEKGKDILDLPIKLVNDWKFPKEDLQIIKNDWDTIICKIKEGKAHELSEGDTFYLGACTKGSTAEKSLREQPYNDIRAKQRAFSLKQGYVNHIIGNIASEESLTYGKILKDNNHGKVDLEAFTISKFSPFIDKTPEEIQDHFNLKINKKAKSYLASLSKVILGIQLDKEIEEFDKAGIIVKTIRLKNNLTPKEDISFPAFKYIDIVSKDWDDSSFKNILERKYFFIFYQIESDRLVLKKVKFWNMPYSDILEAKTVWEKTKDILKKGSIVKEITTKNIRRTYFPKKSENRVSHVRPHATTIDDTFDLPVVDSYTGLRSYTKHSFWLNAAYIRNEIFLK